MCVVFCFFLCFLLNHTTGITNPGFFARAFDLPLGRTKTRRRLRRCELPCKRMLLMSWNAKKKAKQQKKKNWSLSFVRFNQTQKGRRGGHPGTGHPARVLSPCNYFLCNFYRSPPAFLKVSFCVSFDFLCPGVVWFFFPNRSVLQPPKDLRRVANSVSPARVQVASLCASCVCVTAFFVLCKFFFLPRY